MKILSLLFFSLTLTLAVHAQEFKVVTIVESIVPGGIGRSRMIDVQDKTDYKAYTTSRDDGKHSDQDDVKRSDIKVDKFEETKLLNFFSITGINFQNIASNDAVITSKINSMMAEGWQLMFITGGVESDCGTHDGKGIFITRLYFKK